MTTHIHKKTGESQNLRILALLRANRRKWVDRMDLVKVGKAHAINSRAADIRAMGYVVLNKIERVVVNGKVKVRSFYKLQGRASA